MTTQLAKLNAELDAQGLNLYVAEDAANDWNYSVYLNVPVQQNAPGLNFHLRTLRTKSIAAVRRYLTPEAIDNLGTSAAELWGYSIYADDLKDNEDFANKAYWAEYETGDEA